MLNAYQRGPWQVGCNGGGHDDHKTHTIDRVSRELMPPWSMAQPRACSPGKEGAFSLSLWVEGMVGAVCGAQGSTLEA